LITGGNTSQTREYESKVSAALNKENNKQAYSRMPGLPRESTDYTNSSS
jgi:hypothetical protein